MFACIVVFLHSATRFSSKEVVAHVKRIFDITISRQLAHLLIQPFADAFVAAYASEKLVALDESGFDHSCNPLYAYALRGKPAIVTYQPVSDRRRISLLMAMHQNGSKTEIMSDVPINGAAFAAFVNGLPFNARVLRR
jgi:hypothetical protein